MHPMRFHISDAKYDYDVYFKTEQNDNAAGAANIDVQAITICNDTIREILGDDYSDCKTLYEVTVQQYNEIVAAYQNWLQGGGDDCERRLTVGTTNYKHFNHQVRRFVSSGNGQYRLASY